MVHTLRLDNYSPTPRKLVLGTNSSYGTESIKIERGAGWDGLNLTATWHTPGREEPLRVALLDGDAMDVPPEVTKEAKDGVLVLVGLASGVQRASCNVEYLIIEQAGVYGGADAEPTPELAAQVLQAVQDARDAQTRLSGLPIWKQRLLLSTERSNKMAIKSKARHDLTLRSIKREIAAGRDVAFWLDKAYTHYDNGLLDEADIAEVEALAQAYYDAVDARESADEVAETPDAPEVDGAENTTDE